MINETRRTEDAGQAYTAAYTAHYQTEDLQSALMLYEGVMFAHAGTPEAGYSRAQIQNIVNELIPAQELLDIQLKLAFDHLEAVKL